MEQIGGPGSDRIFLVRPDGADRHEVVTGLDGQQEHPDWTPDGARIAFDRWLPDATYPDMDRIDVWVMDADGTDATLVADCVLPCLVSTPAWARDGVRLAWARYDYLGDGRWGPAAIEVLDGERRIVASTADGTTAFYNPRWSADGTQIVVGLETYTDDTQTTLVSSVIAIIAVDGSDGGVPRVVTPPGLDAWEPDWHPGDDRILFRTRFDAADPVTRATPTDIYVIAAHATGITNLTDLGLGDVRAIQPSWTPDGAGIVFTQVDGFGGGRDPGHRADGR